MILREPRLQADALERAEQAAATVVGATIGRSIDLTTFTLLLPKEAPLLDADALAARAQTQGPTVVLPEQRRLSATAALDRAKAEAFPDLTVFLVGGYRGDSRDPVLEGGFAIPLPVFNWNQGAIDAARRERERLDRAIEGERLSVVIACAALARDYTTARIQLERYHGIIVPAAQKALERMELAFTADKATDRDLMSANQALIAAERAEVDARVSLALAIAAIERLSGAPLPMKAK